MANAITVGKSSMPDALHHDIYTTSYPFNTNQASRIHFSMSSAAFHDACTET